MDIHTASTSNPSNNSLDYLSSPEFKNMVREELSDILADFIATQEKRASHVSHIERIVRVEEAQRSHEQLTRSLLEQTNMRFEEMQRNIDKRFDASNMRFEEIQRNIDKRFDASDKRFEEMQKNMDKRFEAMEKRFEAMDKRFEAMDKRFEGLNRRLDRFMFWALGLTISATFLIITFLR